jgi:hypothetical protein
MSIKLKSLLEKDTGYYVWSGTYGKDVPKKMKDLHYVKDLKASMKATQKNKAKHGNARAMIAYEFEKQFPKAFKSLNEAYVGSGMDVRDQIKMADKIAKKHGLEHAKRYKGIGRYWSLEIKDYPSSGTMHDRHGMQIINKNKQIAMKQVQKAAKEMEKYLEDVEVTDSSPSGVHGRIWLWGML